MLKDPAALPAPTPLSSGEPRGTQGASPRPSSSSSQFSHPKAQGITHPGGRCQLSSSPSPLLCSQLSCFGMASNVVSSPESIVGAVSCTCHPFPTRPWQAPHGDPATMRLHGRGRAGYGMLGAHPSAERDLPWHGQGAGRDDPPTAPPRVTSSAAGGTRSIPLLSDKGKIKTQEGGEANWFDFGCAAPSWLRFAR